MEGVFSVNEQKRPFSGPNTSENNVSELPEVPSTEEKRSFLGPSTSYVENDASKGEMICKECKCTFTTKFSLKRHYARKHPSKLQNLEITNNFKFKCSLCNKQFNHNYHLRFHLKSVHAITSNEEAQKFHHCPLCEEQLKKSAVNNHLESKHGFVPQTEVFSFSSYDEFNQWKLKTEKETKSSYIKSSTVVRNSIKYLYFDCHRSGEYQPRGSGQRHLKIQGSKKICAFCPAVMKVTQVASNECTVTFQSKHIGHKNELGHLNLTMEEKESLASKLAAKLPMDAILDDIRTNISGDSLQRLHLLTKKDLHNIERTFGLGSDAIKHPNDAVSVDLWVKEMKEQNSSCSLFYKPQGEVNESYPNLKTDDFVLIIINEAQAEIMRKFGNDCICIDSTHGLNNYSFELTTLLVLDDMRQGFPCAFMISSRTDEDMIQLYFNVIKEINGTIQAQVFMSDMADFYYKAWCHVMGVAQKRLYCTWHVDKAWRNNLKKIKDKEKQVEVYKLLRLLLEERDVYTFNLILDKSIKNLYEDPDTKDFGIYFNTYYSKNCASWAYCYRLHSGINTNMHIERMHKTLKYIYLKGKTVKRLDKAIYSIMRFIRDKVLDRLILISKGKISKKLTDLRNRHKTSLSLTATICKEDDGWNISSSKCKEIYTIKKYKTECKCQLSCQYCKACIHSYICSCPDSAIKWNMCKHIHYFCRVNDREKNEIAIDREDIDELIIDEDKDNEYEVLVKELQKDVTDASCSLENKNAMKMKFINYVDAASTAEEFKLINSTLVSLGLKLDAIRNSSQNRLLTPKTTEPVTTPANKNIKAQRRLYSTKKKPIRKTSKILQKPSDAESESIALSLIL